MKQTYGKLKCSADVNDSIEQFLSEKGVYLSATKGVSMLPFIREGRDTVLLRKPHRELKKFDIVLYKRADGTYVLHRIVRIRNGAYTMRGDHQLIKEQGVTREQIIALASGVYRGGKFIDTSSLRHKLYVLFWVRFVPLRAAVYFIKRLFRS